MKTFLSIILSLFVIYSPESLAATKVSTSTVRYLSGKDTVIAYLCLPERVRGKLPAIIVIHEWWGLNDWVKKSAERLASDGYVTLAVDLYRGHVTTSSDEAHELMRGLPEDRAARDLAAAADFLKSHDRVDPKRIGSVGWCMGGGYSLAAALNVRDLAACVICYGRLVTDSATVATIPCPVLGIFGEHDRGIPAESVREFEALVKKSGKNMEVAIYPGAGHAFMNPTNKVGYRRAAAQDAWRKIDGFLANALKKKKADAPDEH